MGENARAWWGDAGEQQCGDGTHVLWKDWRQGPAFWKLRLGAHCFPIAHPTGVGVCRRPSEVGAPVSHLPGTRSLRFFTGWCSSGSRSQPGREGVKPYRFLTQIPVERLRFTQSKRARHHPAAHPFQWPTGFSLILGIWLPPCCSSNSFLGAFAQAVLPGTPCHFKSCFLFSEASLDHGT